MKTVTFFSVLLCGVLVFQIHSMEEQFHNSKILVVFTDKQETIFQDKKLLSCLSCWKLYTEENFKNHILLKVFFPLNILDLQQHAPFVYYQNLHPSNVTTFMNGQNIFCPISMCTMHSDNPIINFNHIVNKHTVLKKVNAHFMPNLTCWCGRQHDIT